MELSETTRDRIFTDIKPYNPDLEWKDQILCAGVEPEIFFPEDRAGSYWHEIQVAEAKSVCGSCVVRNQCLVEALKVEKQLPYQDRVGVIGGTTPAERTQLINQQNRAEQARKLRENF